MLIRLIKARLCLLCLIAAASSVSSQVALNQTDNFSNGTTQNWSKGNNSPAGYLTNQNNQLQNISDGSGQGGKITMFNSSQWAGDYVGAGVTSIKMNVTNVSSSSPLHLRLVFAGSGGQNFITQYASKNAVIIPSGASQSIVFPIEDMDLDKLQSFSTATYQDIFSAVLSLRLIHSVNGGSSNGSAVVATLVIDDITACGSSTNNPLSTPYNETFDGDLSDDGSQPSIFTLTDGSNMISSCQRGSPRDIDYITFNIPQGKILERIDLSNFSSIPSSNLGFIGIQRGSTFTEPPGGANVANLLGGIVYGSAESNSNVLPEMGMLSGAMGFTPALTADDYSLWLNQGSDESCVTLDLIVGDECPVNRSFTNEVIETGVFKAINNINATTGVGISPNANVAFEAGQCILLNLNFDVPLNTTFTADIIPCN